MAEASSIPWVNGKWNFTLPWLFKTLPGEERCSVYSRGSQNVGPKPQQPGACYSSLSGPTPDTGLATEEVGPQAVCTGVPELIGVRAGV